MTTTTPCQYGVTIDGRSNKVAAVTGLFWLLKILATTLGETAGDMMSMTLGLGYLGSLCMAALFLLAMLFIQTSRRRFTAPVYWLTIIATTITGTEIADALDRSLGLGYVGGMSILLATLAAVLAAWQWLGSGIRAYPILRRQTELFYWAAILSSNTLGTALGDFFSDSVGLSYLTASAITAAMIGTVYLLHRSARVPSVLAFWAAFVLTRPFGATFGDFLTKPIAHDGLALGTINASVVAFVLMVLLLLMQYKGFRLQKA